MATSVQPRGIRFQLRVTHKLLPKAFFATFDEEEGARNYGEQLVALLNRGIVPVELTTPAPNGDDPLVVELIREYTKLAPITASDDAILTTLMGDIVGLRYNAVSFQWAESYVYKLKTVRNLAPGSIRKRVGALARVIDWHTRRVTSAGATPRANVLRLLPSGYSAYSRAEGEVAVAAKKVVKRDIARDRRITADEEQAILAALAGRKRDGRERALEVDPALITMFKLILDTGLRLREAYRLRVDQVDLERKLLHVEGSKGHRGVIKPRFVPLKPAVVELLREWCRDRVGLMFPFWNGVPEDLKKVTGRLSARFSKLFEYAGVADLTEHDLRHEATCRWVTLRSAQGAWLFSDVEVCRIMGWTDPKIMLRYASLRGEDLAERMAAL